MGCGMITERERQLLDWIAENPLISQQELADKAGITRSSVAVHISNLMKKGFIQGKGYILQMSPYVVVVGAVNIDIAGMSFRRLVGKDSNPGTVHMSLGGVGRNIAHNLALLDVEVKFITAFGEDIHAGEIQHSCRENGIDITHSRSVSGASTSTYMFITDENGDMQLAVSDMEIYSYLTPEYIASKLDVINNASLCVIDTNLPAEDHPVSLRKLYSAHLCRSGVHRQGSEAAAGAGQDPHHQAQYAGSSTAHRHSGDR